MNRTATVRMFFLTWRGGSGLFREDSASVPRRVWAEPLVIGGGLQGWRLDVQELGTTGQWVADSSGFSGVSDATTPEGLQEDIAQFLRDFGRLASPRAPVGGQGMPMAQDSPEAASAKRMLFKRAFPRTFALMEAEGRPGVDPEAARHKAALAFEIERIPLHPVTTATITVRPDMAELAADACRKIADGKGERADHYLWLLANHWDDFQDEGLSWAERARRIGMETGTEVRVTTLKSGGERIGLHTGAKTGPRPNGN